MGFHYEPWWIIRIYPFKHVSTLEKDRHVKFCAKLCGTVVAMVNFPDLLCQNSAETVALEET